MYLVLVTTESPDIIERMKNKDSSVTLREIFMSDEAKSMYKLANVPALLCKCSLMYAVHGSYRSYDRGLPSPLSLSMLNYVQINLLCLSMSIMPTYLAYVVF